MMSIRVSSLTRLALLLGLLVVLGLQPAVSQQKKEEKKEEKKEDSTLTTATSMLPPGGKAGSTVPVTIAGVRLTGANGFWCEHPGITAKLKPEGATDTVVQADLVVAANVPPGLYQWRLLAERGASPPKLLAISTGPSEVEKEPNDNPEQAQPLPIEGAISGSLEKYQDIDFYKITGKSGDRILILAQAQMLGVPADLAIAVVDRQGKPIALGKDFLQGDPYIDFTFPTEGDFFVQVWNLAPGDQPGRIYRLTATKTPILQYVFPAGGQRGKPVNLQVGAIDPGNSLGGKADGAYHELAVPFTIPADAPLHLPFRVPGKLSLNALPLAVSDIPEINEVEPNNDAKSAQVVPVPVVINGRFPTRGDIDFFKVKGTKGQKLIFDVEAQSLGYKGDLVVTVFDEGGKQLAENNDRTPTDLDPRLEFPVPADGDYIVRLQEVVPQRCIGPKFIYRMTIREPIPDFKVTSSTPTIFMKPGDGAVAVDVERIDGFDGDVTATIEGLPGDVKAEPATIPKGQNKGAIKVIAAPGANGKHFPIKIVAKAKAGERDLTRVAVAKMPFGKTTLTSDVLFLSVNDKFTTPAPPVTKKEETPAAAGGAMLIPAHAPNWRYIAATAVKGDDWIKPEFKDDSWKQAKAPIGYGTEIIAEKKGSELEITGGDVLFRREFMVDAAVLKAEKLKLKVCSDDSAVVYINGKMVDNDTEKHKPMYWNRDIDVPANVLVAGRNVMAVRLINKEKSSSGALDILLEGPGPKK